jgi:hypothetical protein
VHRDRVRLAADLHDRRELSDRVVRRLLVQVREDDVRSGSAEKRVTVRCGLGRDVGSDQATRTGAGIDDDLLPDRFGEARGHDAHDHVVRIARAERNDDAYRSVGIRVS